MHFDSIQYINSNKSHPQSKILSRVSSKFKLIVTATAAPVPSAVPVPSALQPALCHQRRFLLTTKGVAAQISSPPFEFPKVGGDRDKTFLTHYQGRGGADFLAEDRSRISS